MAVDDLHDVARLTRSLRLCVGRDLLRLVPPGAGLAAGMVAVELWRTGLVTWGEARRRAVVLAVLEHGVTP